jgi:protoporphyrinogen/coproporphyrinogen III oxidase
MHPARAPVVIIGAGISGLAAAYELVRRGIVPVVLEASDRPGGLILTDRDGPLVIDGGPDSMLVAKSAGLELCEELGLTPRLIRTLPPRTACVLRSGRLHAIPQPAVLGLPLTWGALARASMISPGGRFRMALEPFMPPRPKDDESISEFVGRRFGREAVQYLADPLLAGIHAGDPARLSMHALFPSVVEAERATGSVGRGLRRVGPPTRAPEGLFVSLPRGMQELVEALSAALPAGTIRLSSPVSGIQPSAGGLFDVRAAQESLSARSVILAAPAWSAASMVAPLDPELSSRFAEIPYSSTAIVVLAYAREQVTRPVAGSGFVVPRAESASVLAGTWITSKWEGRAPAGQVLMRLFVGGARDPAAVDRSDTELIEQAVAFLAPIAGLAGRPALARVYRWQRASAQHEVGHLSRMRAIEHLLARQPGLFVTGSGFRVTGIPDCIADARATASAAAAFVAN